MFIHQPKNPSAPPALITVLHQRVPGRLRVKVTGLKRTEQIKTELEHLLSQLEGILSVSANTLTGNVLINFDQKESPARIIKTIEKHVREKGINPSGNERSEQVKSNKKTGSTLDQTLKSLFSRRLSRASAEKRSAPQPAHPWHMMSGTEVIKILETSERGLDEPVAANRLAHYGPNRLADNEPRSGLKLFLEQFISLPVAMLAGSAVISVFTGGLVDAGVIIGVVLINATIGYFTESAAEKTIMSLSQLSPTQALVRRAGRQSEIPIAEVVLGDVLILSPGSYIAADARLLSSSRLTVDESALTGESLPATKQHKFLAEKNTPLGDRHNMVYRGTVVTGGSGRAVVVATGRSTEIGVIQSLVGQARSPETPLQRQLDAMGLQLVLLSSGICAAVFGIGVLRGFSWLAMLKSSISLAVAAVPEGLPTVATTTLALGIKNMQRQRVLIRQLPAVESLGSVQVICLDKTGTLTLNRMSVVAIRTVSTNIAVKEGHFIAEDKFINPRERPDLKRLLQVICLCSESKLSTHQNDYALEGSPTENALLEVALNAGEDIQQLRRRYPLARTIHRAEDRPYMITVHEEDKDRFLIAVKGSPAEVLSLCRWMRKGDELEELNEEKRAAILDRNEAMAGQALRVLGVAYGHSQDRKEIPSELVWLGLIGMEDAIRPDMDKLMAQFHQAGIETVMITGDQSATAFSVGKRLGLGNHKPLETIDSTHLDKLDPAILAGLVKHTTIFARVSPAHKLKIVQALQRSGQVIAMTGDGINDGPALKAADVGVAMGSRGAEVARSIADVVLEDDNLHTMIIAIRQGRTIYSNIRKSLRFLLATNLSEIEVMLAGVALGASEILNPMQLLWINLLTDIFPGLALALDPPERDVLQHPPRDPKESIIRREDFSRLAKESAIMTTGTLSAYGYGLLRYGAGPKASTHAFMTLTLAQLLHAISCRSEETTIFDRKARPPNHYLKAAIAGSFLLQLSALLIPPLRQLLGLTPLGLLDSLVIGTGAGLPLLINEATKRERLGEEKES